MYDRDEFAGEDSMWREIGRGPKIRVARNERLKLEQSGDCVQIVREALVDRVVDASELRAEVRNSQSVDGYYVAVYQGDRKVALMKDVDVIAKGYRSEIPEGATHSFKLVREA